MIGLLCLFLALLTAQFKSKSRLEVENAALRRQLIVLRRKVPGRVRLTNNDRWFLIQLYRWFPAILHVVNIVQPERCGGIGRAFVGICRKADWLNPPRVRRPSRDLRRAALAPG